MAKNMMKNFPIHFNGQIYSFSGTIDIIENLLKFIETTFKVNIKKYKIAIMVLKAIRREFQYNMQDHKPTKAEIKETIDVLKEIRTYNISDERERQYIENATEYVKFLVDNM